LVLPLVLHPKEVPETMQEEEPPVVLLAIQPQDAGTVSSVCGTSSGTRFNLEPRTDAGFQHTESVDFLRNRVAAGVDLIVGGARDSRGLGFNLGGGYYVNRDADCAPEFEGGLPAISANQPLESPVVAADPARQAFFIVSSMVDSDTEEGTIGLFRSPAATLLKSHGLPEWDALSRTVEALLADNETAPDHGILCS
jgi:hypothetical protein